MMFDSFEGQRCFQFCSLFSLKTAIRLHHEQLRLTSYIGARILLPTAREGNVFRGVCHSVHNRPHDDSVTAHPYYGVVGTRSTGMLPC